MSDPTQTGAPTKDEAVASEPAAEALFAHLPTSVDAARDMAEAIRDVGEKIHQDSSATD